MDITLLTSIVALFVALSSIIFTYLKLQSERDQWRKEFEDQRDQWQKEHDAELKSRFLNDLVKERYRTYPAVLRVLGSVRDVPDPKEEHWQSLAKNPEPRYPTRADSRSAAADLASWRI